MPTVRYTSVNGEILAEKRGGVRKLYVPDPLGSTAALLNTSQAKTDTFTYWPYGEERSVTGTTPTPFRFGGTGGYYRDTSSRSYVRARHYQPNYGRWLTEETIPSESEISPYVYTGNNPLIWVDPDGADRMCPRGKCNRNQPRKIGRPNPQRPRTPRPGPPSPSELLPEKTTAPNILDKIYGFLCIGSCATFGAAVGINARSCTSRFGCRGMDAFLCGLCGTITNNYPGELISGACISCLLDLFATLIVKNAKIGRLIGWGLGFVVTPTLGPICRETGWGNRDASGQIIPPPGRCC